MNCNDYRQRISYLLENELSPREQKKTLQHEEGCPGCAHLRQQVQMLLNRMKRLGKAEVSTQFEGNLRQNLAERESATLSASLRRLFIPSGFGVRGFALAAASMVVVFAGSYLYLNRPDAGDVSRYPSLSSPTVIEKVDDGTTSKVKTDEAVEGVNEEDEETDADSSPDATGTPEPTE